MKVFFDSTRFTQDPWRKAFARISSNIDFVDTVEQAEHVLVWYPERWDWRAARQLKSLTCLGAGVDAHIHRLHLPQGCELMRLADAGMASAMVDYARYVFSFYRLNFDVYLLNEELGRWQSEAVRPVPEWRIGVMGAGPLGLAVAKDFAAMGAQVALWSRSEKALPVDISGFFGLDNLIPFFQRSEFLICLLPLTSETRNLLCSKYLRILPEGAALANLSRGEIICEQDLMAAIDSGHLRGAYLDVSPTEPLPADHGYWRHPKIHITPHVAAPTDISASVEQIARSLQSFAATGEFLPAMLVPPG